MARTERQRQRPRRGRPGTVDLLAMHADDAPAAADLGGADAVEVPLVTTETGLPVVDVLVDGQGPYRFGVETGAQFVGMQSGLGEKLGLELSPDTVDLPRYHAPNVTIGGATFTDVPMMEIRTAATDIDGILGFPFWRSLAFTIDYPAQRFVLQQGGGPKPGSASSMPIVPIHDGNFLGVDVTIGDRSLTALVDTRSMGAIGFTPASAELVEFDGELQVIGMARGAAIPESEVHGGRLLHDLVLAGHRVVRPFASVRPLPEHFPAEPVLGSVVLRQFRLTIDVAGGWMDFERDGDGPVELPEPRRRVQQQRRPRSGD